MRLSVWLGIALIVAGVAVYLRGGITTKEELVEVGPLTVSTSEKRPVPRWIPVVAIGAGVLLVAAGLRQKA